MLIRVLILGLGLSLPAFAGMPFRAGQSYELDGEAYVKDGLKLFKVNPDAGSEFHVKLTAGADALKHEESYRACLTIKADCHLKCEAVLKKSKPIKVDERKPFILSPDEHPRTDCR